MVCRDRHFGEDQIVGIPCIMDSDCFDGSWCDLIQGSCKYPVDNSTVAFLEVCQFDAA